REPLSGAMDGRSPGVGPLCTPLAIGGDEGQQLRGEVVEEMRLAETQDLGMRIQKLLHPGGSGTRQAADEERRQHAEPSVLVVDLACHHGLRTPRWNPISGGLSTRQGPAPASF